MILKLLENGGSRLIDDVVDCRFSRAPKPHVVYKQSMNGEARADLFGDCFVLNERGDTIDKFYIDPRKGSRP